MILEQSSLIDILLESFWSFKLTLFGFLGPSIFIQDLFKEKMLLHTPSKTGNGEKGYCSDVPVMRSTVMQL